MITARHLCVGGTTRPDAVGAAPAPVDRFSGSIVTAVVQIRQKLEELPHLFLRQASEAWRVDVDHKRLPV